MITKNTRNNPIKTPITTVVPHPGATFPHSELSGLKISPNRVRNAILLFKREMNSINVILLITYNDYY